MSDGDNSHRGGLHVVVCIKQVPGTTEVEIDPESKRLAREKADSVVNPLDLFAVEEALRLREKLGGTVTALSLGPAKAEDALREVLAMGVDEASLVTGGEFAGSDTWATSLALAEAIRTLGRVDLILCGKQAVDGDTAHVGPELAVHLGIPQAVFVRRVLDVSKDAIVVSRLTDAGTMHVRLPLPCLVTVVKEINEPRLPNLHDLYRARHQAVGKIGATDLSIPDNEMGISGSPTRVVDISRPVHERRGRIWEGDLEAGLGELLDAMEAEGLL